MKKILTLIMLLICTALILASCADSDLSVTVTENGGTIAYEYYVDKEIADEYNISIYTVISHRRNISRKLGINTISGLTVYAIMNKLIDISSIQ